MNIGDLNRLCISADS